MRDPRTGITYDAGTPIPMTAFARKVLSSLPTPTSAGTSNNYTILHSRTEFEDFENPEQKRCLFRLWLAPPDGVTLPESWRPFFRSVEAGTVRGGIIGQGYDDARRGFEARQAADLGMRPGA